MPPALSAALKLSPALATRSVPVLPPGGGVRSLRGPAGQGELFGGDASPAPAAPCAPSAPPVPPAPDRAAEPPPTLHPELWRASQLSRPRAAVFASGFGLLDATLPGGGWPAQGLTELLLPHAGVGELRLLAPALAALQAAGQGTIWFDPPAEPDAWALQGLGIGTQQLVVVRSRVPLKGKARTQLPAADILWALEQALLSGSGGALLAWLPVRLPAEALRRLQLAAQAHAGPAFLLREAEARQRPSMAPLRLLLASAGPDALRVHLLKRRGPPLAQPLTLALPPVLAPHALRKATQRLRPPALQGDAAVPAASGRSVDAAPPVTSIGAPR